MVPRAGQIETEALNEGSRLVTRSIIILTGQVCSLKIQAGRSQATTVLPRSVSSPVPAIFSSSSENTEVEQGQDTVRRTVRMQNIERHPLRFTDL